MNRANPLRMEKTRLLDFAFDEPSLRSFADLGGVWGYPRLASIESHGVVFERRTRGVR